MVAPPIKANEDGVSLINNAQRKKWLDNIIIPTIAEGVVLFLSYKMKPTNENNLLKIKKYHEVKS